MTGPRTLAGRTFALVFLLCLLVMLASAAAATAASYSSYEQQAEAKLLTQASAVADSLEGSPDEGSMCDELADYAFVDTRCTLVRADGEVAFDSDVPPSEMDNHLNREEIQAARESGSAVSLRKSQTIGSDMLYAADSLSDGHVLRLSESRTSLASYLAKSFPQLAVSLVVIFILSLLAARVITRMVASPLRDIDLANPLQNDAYAEVQPLLARVDSQKRTLQAQNEELKHAMSLRREFTGNVSHEMKTPLQVISGYAELMENGLVEPGDVPRFAGLIRREAESMRILVDDILVLSKLDEAVVHPDEKVNVASAFRQAATRLSAKSGERGVSVDIVGDESCTVSGNGRLVEQMAYNLLDNAIRFSPRGGCVTVAIAASSASVRIRVSDMGPGIPDELKGRVFERFFRVDESRTRETGGTGLGLAIAKHVAEGCGGTVHIEDNVPRGAVFVIEIPAVPSLQ